MKKLLFILSVFLMVSCGGSQSEKSTDAEEQNTEKQEIKAEEQEEPEVSSTSSNADGSCEKFLNDYEKWVEEVVVVVKKMQENPADQQNTQKMMAATQKMSEWSQKWIMLIDCAKDEKYAKRMEELQKKVTKELNLEAQ